MQELSRVGLALTDNSFERDPRRIQEKRCRPYADKIYTDTFGEGVVIKRFEQEDDFILDKTFAMDVRLTLPSGLILTGQEKFLSKEYAHYRTVTIEHLQNQFTKEQGDWYKMAVQFYFTGYENGGNFFPWMILDWAAVVIATENNAIKWQERPNKDGRARASFRFAFMDAIPKNCVISCKLKEG